MKTEFCTVEKLPNRKTFSLNRKEPGVITPIAYFKSKKDAIRFLNEVSK
jgi:hypothetical protein